MRFRFLPFPDVRELEAGSWLQRVLSLVSSEEREGAKLADTIIEVHSVSAASEWYFRDFAAASLADLRPVVCFALVSTFDPAYPALGASKSIIPLSVDEVGVSLIGTEVSATTADLIGKAEAQALFA